jgi:nitrate reductase beta subunit
MRTVRIERRGNASILEDVGLSIEQAEQIYRLLALAPYTERFVLPTASKEQPMIHADQGRCGFAEFT